MDRICCRFTSLLIACTTFLWGLGFVPVRIPNAICYLLPSLSISSIVLDLSDPLLVLCQGQKEGCGAPVSSAKAIALANSATYTFGVAKALGQEIGEESGPDFPPVVNTLRQERSPTPVGESAAVQSAKSAPASEFTAGQAGEKGTAAASGESATTQQARATPTGEPMPPVAGQEVPLLPVPGAKEGSSPGGSEKPTGPSLAELTTDEIQLRIQRAQSDPELPEDVKAAVVADYERALQELAAAANARGQAEEFRRLRDAIPEQVKTLEAELKVVSTVPALPATDQMTLEQIQDAAQEAEKALNAARSQRDAVDAEAAKRSAARQTAAQRAETAQKRLETARQALAAPPPEKQHPALTEAQRIRHQAEMESARWELEAIQSELGYYDKAEETILPLEKRVAAQRYRTAEAVHNQWQQILAQQRQVKAMTRVEQAKARIAQLPEPLRELAKEIEKKAADVANLTKKVNDTDSQLTAAKQQLEELQQQFKATTDRMEMVGMTGAVGLWLRAQRSRLPDTYALWQRIKKRQSEIRSIQWTLLELSDRHAQLPSLEEEIARWQAQLADQMGDHPEWEEALRELLGEQYALAEEELQLHGRWLNTLVDLDNNERALAKRIEEYRRFIDEHILWIPSATFPAPAQLPQDFRLTLGVIHSLIGWDMLREAGDILWQDFVTMPGLWVLTVLALLVWGLAQLRSRSYFAVFASRVGQGAYHGFWPTLEAAVLTVLNAAWLPAVLAFLSWRLTSPAGATGRTMAVAKGLLEAARFLVVADALRRIVLPQGLGEAHFRWSAGILTTLRRHLRWFVPLTSVLIYLCTAIHASGEQRWEVGPGRWAIFALLLCYAALAQLLLRPKGPLMEGMQQYNSQSWIYRGRGFWWSLGVGIPLGLAIADLVGYVYTARQLLECFRATLVVPVLLGLAEEFFNRWLLVRKQRIGWERFRQRRAVETRQAGEATSEVGGVLVPPPESGPDLAQLGKQTRRLFSVCQLLVALAALWWIWAGVLPALQFLDQIRLWGGTTTTVRPAELAGTAEKTSEQQPAFAIAAPSRPVTLADLIMAILILIAGGAIARNIPGLMEIVLPHRLPMDAGLRYALHAVTSYLVTGVALVMACGRLGLTWSQAQWLVAALGVGLGFGLQEIFANFVSGLIILFERPIRVGDLVTIGDVSGVVTRIRIRATTVLNFDRRELIVPNKEFITGKVLNWTLSDPMNRVELAVGVAYGSDPEQVIQILLEAARSNPNVLTDPGPSVVFEGFQESSINFRLYAYVANYDNRLATINGLHADVYRRLNEAGIAIPFPQRDVHLYHETADKPQTTAVGRGLGQTDPQGTPQTDPQGTPQTDSQSIE